MCLRSEKKNEPLQMHLSSLHQSLVKKGELGNRGKQDIIIELGSSKGKRMSQMEVNTFLS